MAEEQGIGNSRGRGRRGRGGREDREEEEGREATRSNRSKSNKEKKGKTNNSKHHQKNTIVTIGSRKGMRRRGRESHEPRLTLVIPESPIWLN